MTFSTILRITTKMHITWSSVQGMPEPRCWTGLRLRAEAAMARVTFLSMAMPFTGTMPAAFTLLTLRPNTAILSSATINRMSGAEECTTRISTANSVIRPYKTTKRLTEVASIIEQLRQHSKICALPTIPLPIEAVGFTVTIHPSPLIIC